MHHLTYASHNRAKLHQLRSHGANINSCYYTGKNLSLLIPELFLAIIIIIPHAKIISKLLINSMTILFIYHLQLSSHNLTNNIDLKHTEVQAF